MLSEEVKVTWQYESHNPFASMPFSFWKKMKHNFEVEQLFKMQIQQVQLKETPVKNTVSK